MTRDDHIIINAVVFTLAIFSYYFLSEGVIVFFQAWISVLVSTIIGILYMIIARYIPNRISGYIYPCREELLREDKTLMRYIIFIQGIIFFTMDIILSSEINISFFKILLLVVTLFFITTRSYAHIRDDNVWRWRSIKYSIYLFLAEFSVIILPYFASSYIFLNEFTFGVSLIIISVILALIIEIFSARFKTRYEEIDKTI